MANSPSRAATDPTPESEIQGKPPADDRTDEAPGVAFGSAALEISLDRVIASMDLSIGFKAKYQLELASITGLSHDNDHFEHLSAFMHSRMCSENNPMPADPAEMVRALNKPTTGFLHRICQECTKIAGHAKAPPLADYEAVMSDTGRIYYIDQHGNIVCVGSFALQKKATPGVAPEMLEVEFQGVRAPIRVRCQAIVR